MKYKRHAKLNVCCYFRRIHTGEKPHACPDCPKRFARSSQLKDHHERHSSEKRHVCVDCSHKFYTNTQLKVHRKRHIEAELSE